VPKTISFAPMGRGLLCRELPEKKRESTLVVVEQYGSPCLRAEVVACGPEVRDISVGDRIVVPSIAGMNLDLGEPMLLVNENVVLATLEKGE